MKEEPRLNYAFEAILPGGGRACYAVPARSEQSARRYLRRVMHIRRARLVGVWQECPPHAETRCILLLTGPEW